MVDFMANIKNEKNMTKCNIKTFVATSVLCVFFNGVLIYGMKEGDKDGNINSNNGNEKQLHLLQESSNYESCKSERSFYNENKSLKINPKNTIEKLKMKKKTKGDILKNIRNIRKNILRNYKGHLSLCLCCNLFNNKEENMHKFFIKQENLELMPNIKNMSGYNKYSPLMPVKCYNKDINDINDPNNGSNNGMFEMKEINSGL